MAFRAYPVQAAYDPSRAEPMEQSAATERIISVAVGKKSRFDRCALPPVGRLPDGSSAPRSLCYKHESAV
jgi:hypothetical protein